MTRGKRVSIRAVLLTCTVLLFSAFVRADLYEAAQATVRVRCGNGVGSGIVVGSNDKAYFALTNAHVADQANCTIEFFSGGRMSAQVPGCKTVSRDVGNDVAVIQIEKDRLSGHVPSIIPIDPAYELKPGMPIGSIGHPHGENPTAFMGAFIKMYGGSICFQPPPKQGRSGSALFDKDFTRVVGLIWGCDTEKAKERLGYAVPAKKFSIALGKELTKVSVASADKIDFEQGRRFTCFDANVEKTDIEIEIGDVRLGLKEDRKQPKPTPPVVPFRRPVIPPPPLEGPHTPVPAPHYPRPLPPPPPRQRPGRLFAPRHAAGEELNKLNITLCQYSAPCYGGTCPGANCPESFYSDGTCPGYGIPGYPCPNGPCPNGSCPTIPGSGTGSASSPTTDIAPTVPIPVERADDVPPVLPNPEEFLPNLEIQPESAPAAATVQNKAGTDLTAPQEIPVAIADKRLEKLDEIPAIKTGLFNMANDTQSLKDDIARLVAKLKPLIDGIEIDESGRIVKLKELEERFLLFDERLKQIYPLIAQIRLDQEGNLILPDVWRQRLEKLDAFDGTVKVGVAWPTVNWQKTGYWLWNLLLMVVAGVGAVHVVSYIQNRNAK